MKKKPRSIKQLVWLALEDKTNTITEYHFSKVSKAQAKILSDYVDIDLTGAERVIDTYAIRHVLRQHGSEITETSRGQIPINIDDFTLIPSILSNPDNIEYANKNKQGQHVFRYYKRINSLYIIVEAVRISKERK